MDHYKLTEELAAKMKDAIDAMAPLSIKDAEKTGTFEVVISTEDEDRQGEIVRQNGLMLDRYKANPVVLWAHNYSELPVGVCDNVETQGTKTVAKGRFASHDFAQQVRKLYDAGFLRTTSVGFIPLEMDGNIITRAELLEFSFVPVPANPFALSVREATEMQLNVGELVAKGVFNQIAKTEDGEPALASVPVEEAPAAAEDESKDDPEKPKEDEQDDEVKEAVDELAKAIGSLKETVVALQKQVDELNGGETPDDETEPGEGETPAGEAEVKNLNQFTAERAALKAVAGAVSDALAQMNERAREHYKNNS